jgi:hypothetical protein
MRADTRVSRATRPKCGELGWGAVLFFRDQVCLTVAPNMQIFWQKYRGGVRHGGRFRRYDLQLSADRFAWHCRTASSPAEADGKAGEGQAAGAPGLRSLSFETHTIIDAA